MMRPPTAERHHPAGFGVQRIFRFANGRGVSLAGRRDEEGRRLGDWDAAVVRYWGPGPWDWDIDWEQRWMKAMLSRSSAALTDAQVEALLDRVEALPDLETTDRRRHAARGKRSGRTESEGRRGRDAAMSCPEQVKSGATPPLLHVRQ